MEILEIVETLQSLSGNPVFADAANLLIEQGERIVDLESKLGGWIPVSLGFTPEPFISVLGYMTDAGDFPPSKRVLPSGHRALLFPGSR